MHNAETIWRTYHAKLLNFIKNRVSQQLDAEDLLQEIFIKALPKLNDLKESSKLESWLFQITRNTIIDYYRTNKVSENLPDWLTTEDLGNQFEETELNRQALSECLTPLIDALPTDYRLAIHQSEIQGLTQQNIADLDGLSLSGAKSRVQRGRALLKDLLHQCCEFELNQSNQIEDFHTKKTASSRLICKPNDSSCC